MSVRERVLGPNGFVTVKAEKAKEEAKIKISRMERLLTAQNKILDSKMTEKEKEGAIAALGFTKEDLKDKAFQKTAKFLKHLSDKAKGKESGQSNKPEEKDNENNDLELVQDLSGESELEELSEPALAIHDGMIEEILSLSKKQEVIDYMAKYGVDISADVKSMTSVKMVKDHAIGIINSLLAEANGSDL